MTRAGKCVLLVPAAVSVAALVTMYETKTNVQRTDAAMIENLVSSCHQWQDNKNAGHELMISTSTLFDLFSPILNKYGLKPGSTLKEGLEIIYNICHDVSSSDWNINVFEVISNQFQERLKKYQSNFIEDPLFYSAWQYVSALMKIATQYSAHRIPEDFPSIQAVFGAGKIANLIFETLVLIFI